MVPALVEVAQAQPEQRLLMAHSVRLDVWVAARVARQASVVRLPVSHRAPEGAEQA